MSKSQLRKKAALQTKIQTEELKGTAERGGKVNGKNLVMPDSVIHRGGAFF